MNSGASANLIIPVKRRLSVFLKIASIGVLIALLHIPLAMTHGVLLERRTYQAQATKEVAEMWGREQLLVGPVLAVPYGYKTSVLRTKLVDGEAVRVSETVMAQAVAYFLPDALSVDGAISPELRHRGIYNAVVYGARAKLSGTFRPDFAAAGIDADEVKWEQARIYFGVSDLHGIRSVGPLKIGGAADAAFEPSRSVPESFLPLTAKVAGARAGAQLIFAMDVDVQGSSRISVAPIGKSTKVTLTSAWANASFVGASLPSVRNLSADGFRAEWESSYLGRGFAQNWTNRFSDLSAIAKKIEGENFGVKFLQPIDGYAMAERAQKYGFLFFVLVFAVFFLFEVTAGLRIHPLQYALVGAGLCLFFLGFLALSEFWPARRAYGCAAAACTLLVALYARSFLGAGWRALVIASGLGATYGYLYFVLKSQDYALIAGTAALFAVLALVMFCTRKINWYAVDLERDTGAGGGAASGARTAASDSSAG
jgi:inner membrane protein